MRHLVLVAEGRRACYAPIGHNRQALGFVAAILGRRLLFRHGLVELFTTLCPSLCALLPFLIELMLGAEHLIREGRLVNLFPDWPDERFPLYAYHPSRHHTPAKTRAFLDFIVTLTSTG